MHLLFSCLLILLLIWLEFDCQIDFTFAFIISKRLMAGIGHHTCDNMINDDDGGKYDCYDDDNSNDNADG